VTVMDMEQYAKQPPRW